jgi:hypothetical protein
MVPLSITIMASVQPKAVCVVITPLVLRIPSTSTTSPLRALPPIRSDRARKKGVNPTPPAAAPSLSLQTRLTLLGFVSHVNKPLKAQLHFPRGSSEMVALAEVVRVVAGMHCPGVRLGAATDRLARSPLPTLWIDAGCLVTCRTDSPAAGHAIPVCECLLLQVGALR